MDNQSYNTFKHGRIIRILNLLFVLLLFPLVNYAQTQSTCTGNGNTTYNECGLTSLDYDQCFMNNIIIQYYETAGNSLDDMEYMTITAENAAGQTLATLFTMTLDYSVFPFVPIYTTGSSVVHDAPGGGFRRVEWANISSSIINSGIIYIRFNGQWIAGNGNSEIIDLRRSVTFAVPGTPNPNPINSNECNVINVSWSDGTAIGCISKYTNIYRDGVYAGAVPFGTNTFSDSGPSGGFQMNTDYEYSVRHFYAGPTGGNLGGGIAVLGNGRIKSTPSPPSGIMVSDDRCDGTVALSWDFVNDADGYRVYRDGVNIYNSTSGTNTSFEDENVVRGVSYNYTISGFNNCGTGVTSQVEIGGSPLEPAGVNDVFVQDIPGVGALISWTPDSLITGYKVERNLLGGGGSAFFNVSANDTFYQDNAIIACETYEYRVLSINDCAPQGVVSDSIRRVKLVPDLSTVFGPNALDASKGYFPDRVQLNWTLDNNENLINAFKIYRRILGDNADSVLITSQNSGSNLYQDNLTDAGVLYEYFIIAELQCDQQTVYSNVASTIGFRSATGTLTGQVSYTGGIAVEGVRISAENSSGAVGSSLLFNGGNSLNIADNNNFDIDDAFTIETWFKPSTTNDFVLAEKEEVFVLSQVSNNVVFEVFTAPTTSQSVSIPSSSFMLNTYNQITATVYNDSLNIFLNGVSLATAQLGDTINENANPLVIGENFEGNLDEFRLWSIGKDIELVNRDFSRQLNGVHPNLEIYLRMNENLGEVAYDFSRLNSSNFNKNHANLVGNPSWSNDIPSANELSTAAFTDAQGNYFLSVPYAGIGETFVITPSYLVHNFSPSTRALFIGDGSIIHNNIDFEDISSFTVQGSLFYDNTSCPVEGATLLVDGNIVVDNGLPAMTNDSGLFNIQVPIGNHFYYDRKRGSRHERWKIPCRQYF